MNIGIQLYSVADDFKKDSGKVLESLAAMGYKGVEFAFDFGSLAPAELKSALEKSGLKALSMYSMKIENLFNPDHDIYTFGKVLKMPYVTVGNEFLVKDWKSAVKLIEKGAFQAKKEGFELMYHNHSAEIELLDGEAPLATLARLTGKDVVLLELDTHFIAKAGGDPLEWIEKHKGRVPLLHIKDIKEDGSVAEPGEGILDMPAICRKAGEAGVQWLVVEFHQIKERTPFESALKSIENLQRLDI